jgi:hypothetical protein
MNSDKVNMEQFVLCVTASHSVLCWVLRVHCVIIYAGCGFIVLYFVLLMHLILLCVVAGVKDLKKNISGILHDSSLDWDVPLETSSASGMKQSHVRMEFLQSIDQTGELTDTSAIPVDVVKYERNVRAERSSRILDDAK